MVHIRHPAHSPGDARRAAAGRCLARLRAAVVALLAASVSPLAAAPGDLWEVQEYSSNLRLGPGTEHGVYTQRTRGDVVMELRRRGDWLEVAFNREGESAWIFASLLERLSARPGEADPSPEFDDFAALFDPDHPGNRLGVPVYFDAPVHLEFGVVRVDARAGFRSLTGTTRNSHLSGLLRLWATVDNSGVPVTVIVRDPDTGRRVLIRSQYRGAHDLDPAWWRSGE